MFRMQNELVAGMENAIPSLSSLAHCDGRQYSIRPECGQSSLMQSLP